MTPKLETHPHFESPELSGIDPSLIRSIARLRWRRWVAVAIVAFGLFPVAGLFGYPQNYSATVSISMQQPNQAASALQALTGNTTKKYTGVLKSRRFAETVDKSVHFRDLMGLPNTRKHQDEALEKVIKDLKVDDNSADGLLYITVNLGGPARLAPDPATATRFAAPRSRRRQTSMPRRSKTT